VAFASGSDWYARTSSDSYMDTGTDCDDYPFASSEPYANLHSGANGYIHADTDCLTYSLPYLHEHSYSYLDVDDDEHADGYPYAHCDAFGYGIADVDTHAHAVSHTNTDSDPQSYFNPSLLSTTSN
jgi:hypothetical protein